MHLLVSRGGSVYCEIYLVDFLLHGYFHIICYSFDFTPNKLGLVYDFDSLFWPSEAQIRGVTLRNYLLFWHFWSPNKVVGTSDPMGQTPPPCLANVPSFALFFILKASLSSYHGRIIWMKRQEIISWVGWVYSELQETCVIQNILLCEASFFLWRLLYMNIIKNIQFIDY